ncbi:MAG: hypothetical protein CML65_00405 [Rhodobacteraceae bacterium]|nr:hypothetical protein [Paracoccaceae bacterium]
MPHDHPHDHHHHPHDHNHSHGPDHLHSHMHEHDEAEDIQVLATQFIDGFRSAADKSVYLQLAGVPRELPDDAGGAPLKLVDVQLTTEWQVGTASPSFGSAELSYLPYPGSMVTERTNMGFVYVSMTRKQVMDLRGFLATKHGRHAG